MAIIKITRLSAPGVAVRGNDIDTDRIIPARFMKCVTFEGLGEFAFYDARRDETGALNSHPFNDPASKGAGVLVVNQNFGCGSSREHAPQALEKWGIKALIGESFAEIFAGNCCAMGIPAVCLAHADLERLQSAIEDRPGLEITIDLAEAKVYWEKESAGLTMPAAHRSSLLDGSWDSTAVLLEDPQAIGRTASNLAYLNSFSRV